MSDKPETTWHACDIVDQIEKKLVKCTFDIATEMGDKIGIKEVLEIRKMFDRLRSPLGCGERKDDVERVYESL